MKCVWGVCGIEAPCGDLWEINQTIALNQERMFRWLNEDWDSFTVLVVVTVDLIKLQAIINRTQLAVLSTVFIIIIYLFVDPHYKLSIIITYQKIPVNKEYFLFYFLNNLWTSITFCAVTFYREINFIYLQKDDHIL